MDKIEKYARLNADGVVVETFTPIDDGTGEPVAIEKVFSAATAALFVPVPADSVVGSKLAGETWTHPAAREPESLALRKLSVLEFYLAFTPDERIKIKSSLDPMVREFWETYEMLVRTSSSVDPNLPSVKAALGYMAGPVGPDGTVILANEGRIADILTGKPQ